MGRPEAKHFVDTKADKVISLLNKAIKSQEQIKAEAIKEFAERLNHRVGKYTEYDEGGWDSTIWAVKIEIINSIMKEMTEERK